MEELFFKVWSNVKIRNLILSYKIKSRNSLLSLVNNKRYKSLLEKLKRNETVEIEKEGLNQLLVNASKNIYFDEIFQLLWNTYKEEVKMLDPLKMIVFQIDSIDLFKKIYSYISTDDSNNNNSIIINQSYKLYDLLDYYFKSNNKSINNNTIPEFIINEIKNNSNSNIIKNKSLVSNNNNSFSYNNNRKKIKKEVENESDKNIKELLNAIYSSDDCDGANSFSEIPLFLGYNIKDIANSLTKEKLQFFNNNIGLNMVEQIRKYLGETGFKNQKGESEVLSVPSNNNEINEDCLGFYLKLTLYGGVSISVPNDEINLINVDYIKLYLLSRMILDKNIDYEKYKLNLIENKSRIVSLNSLVNNIQEFKRKTTGSEVNQEDLVLYFGVYIIYYYLEINDYKQVEQILNSNYINSYGHIKSLSISFLFYYSILNLSTPVFQLYYKYQNKINNENNNKQKRNLLKVFNQKNLSETDKSKVSSFYKQLLSNDSFKQILNQQLWKEIIKIQMFNYGSSIFWYLLNEFKEFQLHYIDLIKTDKWGMLYLNFKWAEEGRLPDYKLIGIYNHFIKQIPSNQCEEKPIQKDCPFSFNRIKNYYGMFLSSCFDLGLSNYTIFFLPNLVTLHKEAENKSLNQCIRIFKFLNERSLYNYYSSVGDGQIHQYFINKSCILINNLMKSIIKKEYQSINKILSVVYNKNINISSELKELNNCFEVIYFLITNKYLKGFPLKLVLDWVVTNMEPSNQFIYDCIPSDDTNLIEYYKDQFKSPNIAIKYNVEDVIYEDEEFIDNDEDSLNSNENSNQINDRKIYSSLYNKNYYQVLKYLKVKSGPLNLDQFEELKLCSVRIPTQWFSKLYTLLYRRILKRSYQVVIELLVSNDLNVFDFIWNQHLSNDKEKIELVMELLKDRSIELKFKKWKQKLILKLVLVILKEKKQFFNINSSGFNNIIKSQIIEFLFINAQSKLFSDYIEIFNFNFNISSDLFYESLNSNYGIKACNFIEYLFNNNYITNLKQLVGERINYQVSKSTFILIHSILKYQNINQFQQRLMIQQ